MGGFPGDSVVKHPPASTGDLGSIPGLGRSPGEGNGGLQSSGWQKCQTCCSGETVRTWRDSQLSFYFSGVGKHYFWEEKGDVGKALNCTT